MSVRVCVLPTLAGVVLIGCVVLPPGIAIAQSARDKCLDESEKATIAACDAALKADPRDAEAYQTRGTAYVRQGDNDRAMADYSNAIRLKPEYALPYFNRGLILESKNQLPQALSDFKRAVELDPADDDSEQAITRVTTALTNGRSPSSAAALPAKRSSAHTPTPAAKTASTRTNVVPTRAGSTPTTTGSAPARVSSTPTRVSPASVTATPVLASTSSEPAGADPAPAGSDKRWTFSAAAVGKWISGLRSRQEATPPSGETHVEAAEERPAPQPAPSRVSTTDASVMEAQEYWNDQMALANGGSKDTRRIISLERLGELQKSGILTKQEFENEKRRVLGE